VPQTFFEQIVCVSALGFGCLNRKGFEYGRGGWKVSFVFTMTLQIELILGKKIFYLAV
jgi:hypothetical protein